MARKKTAVKTMAVRKVAADKPVAAAIKQEIKRMLEKLIKAQALGMTAASTRKPPEVRLTKGQADCLKATICAAMQASPTTVMERRKRYCTSGKEGIWIGLEDEQMADLLETAKKDCLRNPDGTALKPIDPILGFTIYNPF